MGIITLAAGVVTTLRTSAKNSVRKVIDHTTYLINVVATFRMKWQIVGLYVNITFENMKILFKFVYICYKICQSVRSCVGRMSPSARLVNVGGTKLIKSLLQDS